MELAFEAVKPCRFFDYLFSAPSFCFIIRLVVERFLNMSETTSDFQANCHLQRFYWKVETGKYGRDAPSPLNLPCGSFGLSMGRGAQKTTQAPCRGRRKAEKQLIFY